MPEAIQNIFGQLSDTPGLIAVGILTISGMLVAALVSFFAIRESEVRDEHRREYLERWGGGVGYAAREPDWSDDVAPWPLASAESLRGGAEALGDFSHPSVQPISHDGEHV